MFEGDGRPSQQEGWVDMPSNEDTMLWRASCTIEAEQWRLDCTADPKLAALDKLMNQVRRGLVTNKEAIDKFRRLDDV